MIVASLDKAAHNRSVFDCGEPALDDFLKTKAAQHQDRRVSRTFVLTETETPEQILGYYSLSNCQVAREELSAIEAKALPRHPIPAVLLARIAVDRSAQGRRFGQWLLMDSIKRCALVGRQTGVYALVVDAKNQSAKDFYERFGFTAIFNRPTTLYLPLETALRSLQLGE